MYQIYKITVAQGISYDCMGDSDLNLKVGDKVVVKCDRYQESAHVTQCKQDEPFETLEEYEARRNVQNKGRHIEGAKLPEILRVATAEDLAQMQENDKRADEVFPKTVERIHAHNLDMKLILAHYSFDRKVLLFQFSAEGRVDFRELLRDLSSMFHVRVELRQVGVRDEAAICGGIGTCGRPFCCSTFLHSINSVNVKMAKQQGLSLNPQSISGCCGRLKCCLQYESEEYAKEAKKNGQKQCNGCQQNGNKGNGQNGQRQQKPPRDKERPQRGQNPNGQQRQPKPQQQKDSQGNASGNNAVGVGQSPNGQQRQPKPQQQKDSQGNASGTNAVGVEFKIVGFNIFKKK